MSAEREKLLFEARESLAAAEQLFTLANEDWRDAYLINEEKGELLQEVQKLLAKCSEYDHKRDQKERSAKSREREAKQLAKQGRRLERQANRAWS